MAGVSAPKRARSISALRMLDAKADRERLGLASPRRARAAWRRCRGRCGRGRARRGRRAAPRCRLRAPAARDRQRRAPGRPRSAGRRRGRRSGSRRRARSISARIFSTTPTSRKVPMCGLATQRISSGAPALTNSSITLRVEVARVADLAAELAVGKGAGAALAELDVGFRIEHAAAPQAPGVLGALAHRAAALEHDRAEAHLRQQQRGEEAAGAEADDHRPRRGAGGEVGRRPGDEAVAGVGRRARRAGRRRGGRAPRPRRRPRSRGCRRRRSPRACARRSRA